MGGNLESILGSRQSVQMRMRAELQSRSHWTYVSGGYLRSLLAETSCDLEPYGPVSPPKETPRLPDKFGQHI